MRRLAGYAEPEGGHIVDETVNSVPEYQANYHLGCPVFTSAGWPGTFLPPKLPRSKWLHAYSRVFNTVEGNSTFYGLPSETTVLRWIQDTPTGFRFLPKIPQPVSHEDLSVNNPALQPFLDRMAPLHEAERLGPIMLQLPPGFGPSRVSELGRFLEGLPQELSYSVEVRHNGFFDQGPAEEKLNEILRNQGVDKVLFDSRPLFSRPAEDETEQISQARKPKTPVRQTLTGNAPVLRFIGRNAYESIDKYIEQWAPIVGRWLSEGRTPYLFMHTPDDAHAPQLAKRFHAAVQREIPLAPLPPWPAEQIDQGQRSLF